MPLCTQIVRDGENHKLPNGWGWWHVECITEVVRRELDIEVGDPTYPLFDLWSRPDTQSGYTVKETHQFTDPADGEELTILPGDVFKVWREF